MECHVSSTWHRGHSSTGLFRITCTPALNSLQMALEVPCGALHAWHAQQDARTVCSDWTSTHSRSYYQMHDNNHSSSLLQDSERNSSAVKRSTEGTRFSAQPQMGAAGHRTSSPKMTMSNSSARFMRFRMACIGFDCACTRTAPVCILDAQHSKPHMLIPQQQHSTSSYKRTGSLAAGLPLCATGSLRAFSFSKTDVLHVQQHWCTSSKCPMLLCYKSPGRLPAHLGVLMVQFLDPALQSDRHKRAETLHKQCCIYNWGVTSMFPLPHNVPCSTTSLQSSLRLNAQSTARRLPACNLQQQHSTASNSNPGYVHQHSHTVLALGLLLYTLVAPSPVHLHASW